MPSPLFIEICEACIPLCGHSLWGIRLLDMNPGYASLYLWGVPLLLGMLPILSDFLDLLLLRTSARPILPYFGPFLVCIFFS